MSFTERILNTVKTVILLEERLTKLTKNVDDLKSKSEQALSDHESRLTRLETIIELTRPDGTTLRLTPP
jgi:predicted component of type VI protein secretion system